MVKNNDVQKTKNGDIIVIQPRDNTRSMLLIIMGMSMCVTTIVDDPNFGCALGIGFILLGLCCFNWNW